MASEFNLFEAWPSRAYVCCHAPGRRHRRGKETTRVGHTAHPPPTPPVCWTRTAPVHFHNREPPPPGSPSNGFLRCHRQPIPSLLHAIEAPLRRRRQGQRRHLSSCSSSLAEGLASWSGRRGSLCILRKMDKGCVYKVQ